jgi:replicative DNA helicase
LPCPDFYHQLYRFGAFVQLLWQKQVRGLSQLLPQEIVHDDDENITIKELGERFSDLNQRKVTELDMMRNGKLRKNTSETFPRAEEHPFFHSGICGNATMAE